MSARFEDLLARLLDDALDAAGRDELAALLTADPALQRRYVAAIQQQVALREQLRGGLTESAQIEASALRRAVGASGTGSVRRRPKRRAAGPRRSRRRAPAPLVPIAVLALLLMVGAGAWLLRPTAPPPAAWLESGSFGDLVPGAALVPGSVHLVGAQGAVLRCADGSLLRLAPGSGVGVLELDPVRRSFRLDQGRAEAVVATLGPGARFVLRTPELSAEVVGTRFSVRHAAEGSEVAVEAGAVRVQARDGRSALLGPGGRFHSRPPEPAVVVEPTPAPVAEPPPAAPDPEPVPPPVAEPEPAAPGPAFVVDGLSDPGWSIAGDLRLEGEGGDRVVVPASDGPGWRGRSFTWPRWLPATQGFDLAATVEVPAGLQGDWHVELAAVAESALDSQGQARRMLRIYLDEEGYGIEQLIDGPDRKQEIGHFGPVVAAGRHHLRLRVVGSQVTAELDGRVFFDQRLVHGYAELRPSLRVARKEGARGDLAIDEVVLRSPPADP